MTNTTTPDPVALLPCPWCGNAPRRSLYHDSVRCISDECPAVDVRVTTKLWNTRKAVPREVDDAAVERAGMAAWPHQWATLKPDNKDAQRAWLRSVLLAALEHKS